MVKRHILSTTHALVTNAQHKVASFELNLADSRPAIREKHFKYL